MLTIGSLNLDNPLVLAPMAGYSDSSARRIARRFGAGLVMSEMVSAAGIVRRAPKTMSLLTFHQEEQPLGIQIFGHDPAEMAEAARIVQDTGASLVDLNLGCPVKKVCRNGAGSALLRQPNKVARLVESVRESIHCPLTVKMRLGWDEKSISAPEIARIAEACGADAIVLHPRTRAQGFRGTADWTWVARLKQERNVPVLGSGDIVTPAAACEVLENGICDGVLIGRASRGNPWIFSQALSLLNGLTPEPPSPLSRYEVILEHLEHLLSVYGRERGWRKSRYMLHYYTKGLPGSSTLRRTLFSVQTERALRELLDEYFKAPRVQSPNVQADSSDVVLTPTSKPPSTSENS